MKKRNLAALLAAAALSVSLALAGCAAEQAPSAAEPIYDLYGTTLHVYPQEGAEYSLDGNTWKTEGDFSGLVRGETYTLSMRTDGSATVEETITVPQTKVVNVFLIGGQSNALGISTASQLLDEDDKALLEPTDDVMIYADGEINQNTTGQVRKWTTVRGGLGLRADTFGLEIGMADILKQYYRAETSDEDTIAFIKYTWGGTALFQRWVPPTSYEEYYGDGTAVYSEIDGRPCGDLYANFVNTVRTQMQALRDRGFDPQIRGMAWMQGEWDALSQISMTAYEHNLKNLICDLRADLNEPEMPFVIGEINTVISGFDNQIRAAQKKAAEETENAYFISTSDLQMGLWDWYHFYAPDMITLGRRFGSALAGIARDIPVSEGQQYEYTYTIGSAFSLPQFVEAQTADGNKRYAYAEWEQPEASLLTKEGSFTLQGKALWGDRSTPISATIHVTKGITLDGIMDEAKWSECKAFDLGDGKTTFRTFYTEEGIYVGAQIKDSSIISNIATGNFDGDMRTYTDNLALYFETTGQNSAQRTTGMSFFWLSANNIMRVYQTDANATWDAGNKYLAQTQMNVDWHLKIDGCANQPGFKSNGYCIEMFIPFETLGITADNISILRWQLEVTEAQTLNVMGTAKYINGAQGVFLDHDNTAGYVKYADYAVAA